MKLLIFQTKVKIKSLKLKVWFWKKLYYLDRNFIKRSTIVCQNGGTATQYFKVERGARQGDPVLTYLFILVLEILFIFIKKHPEIKGIEIFEHCFLYTAYGGDTTFFLKGAQSFENLVEIFNTFSK